MGKNLQRMRKGNLVGYGVGVASLALSGFLLVANEKKEDELEQVQNENIKLNEIIVSNKEVLKDYKAKNFELEDTIKSYEMLTNELNERFSVAQAENEKLKEELEEKKKGYYETTMEVTAYTAGYESTQKKKGHPLYGVTASGVHVKEGVTIACPKSIKFGTVIEIEGYGKRVCQDRGGAIKDGKLDLYMDSLENALAFGRKKLKVKVYTS